MNPNSESSALRPATSRPASRAPKWISGALALVGIAALGVALTRPPRAVTATSAATRKSGATAKRDLPTPGTVAATVTSAFQPMIENQTTARGSAPEGMVWIPGGERFSGARLRR